MEGRTAVRPSGITPDFHAAFKQTWYKSISVNSLMASSRRSMGAGK